MTDQTLKRLTRLKTAPMADLKADWRRLFDQEAPPFNRKYLETRLAYRIQELEYGGLKPQTIKRLEELGERLLRRAGSRPSGSKHRPVSGTRLIREWQGHEHCVTVRRDDFEFEGRPYKSLSAIARAITGSRWNGWVFFGLKNAQGPDR